MSQKEPRVSYLKVRRGLGNHRVFTGHSCPCPQANRPVACGTHKCCSPEVDTLVIQLLDTLQSMCCRSLWWMMLVLKILKGALQMGFGPRNSLYRKTSVQGRKYPRWYQGPFTPYLPSMDSFFFLCLFNTF